MSTMLKIKKDAEMTPEFIQGKLFSYADIAHKFHLDTTSYAEHKAMDKLYSGLVEFKDSISEMLMGYLGGKRIGKIKLDEIPEYSKGKCADLCNDVSEFSYELYEWAGKKKYCDIENTAQSLSGLAASTTYLLTLT